MVNFLKYGINKQLLKPSAIALILKDLFKYKNKIKSNKFHLINAINWISFAQRVTPDGGISRGYSLIKGWEASYPETSGYTIPTLIDYYYISNNKYFLDLSKIIADWECSIQLKNGGFQSGIIGEKRGPLIFNTGQIILGLIRAYMELKIKKYLDSAIKAGDFLIKHQESNGNWIRFCFNNICHTYNIRSAWALLELSLLTNIEKYKDSAINNITWAIKQKANNFWFQNNDSLQHDKPLLHFISYTIRGFLESGLLLNDEKLKKIALDSSLSLLNYYEKYNYLPARFNSDWESTDTYSCLTGDAQLSIIWLKLYKIYKDDRLLLNAIKLINYLKSKQFINKKFNFINGAIKGSDPIWGNYAPYRFPNWATKFFSDALIIENEILKSK